MKIGIGILGIMVLFILVLLNNKKNRKKLKNRETDYFKRPLNDKRKV